MSARGNGVGMVKEAVKTDPQTRERASDDPNHVAGHSDALKRGRERQAELRAAGLLVRLDPIEKARRNPKSMRLAINATCWRCMGSGGDPNTRGAIRDCTSGKTCPLYPLRPYQASDDEADEGDSE